MTRKGPAHAARHAAPKGSPSRATRFRNEATSPAVAQPTDLPAKKNSAPTRVEPNARRDARRVPVAAKIAIVAVLLAIMGGGAYMVWRHMTGAKSGRGEIAAAVTALAASDKSILAFNDVISDTSGTHSAEDMSSAVASANDGLSELDEVDARLAAAKTYDEFLNDDDRAAIQALGDSSAARRDLVAAGTKVLDARAAALNADAKLEESLAKAVQSDEKVRESVEAASAFAQHLAGQESNVTDAKVPMEADAQASTLLKEAADLLAAAKQEFPSADYSAYDNYLNAKRAAIDKLAAADEAVAREDYEAAGNLSNEYNDLDKKAVEAAKELPDDGSGIFTSPLAQETAEALAVYGKAFDRVSDADARVKGYQGVSSSEPTNA